MTQRPMSDAAKASTSGYAWNPVSGRFVKKSGPTYLRLIKCGVLTDPNCARPKTRLQLQHKADDGKLHLRPSSTATMTTTTTT